MKELRPYWSIISNPAEGGLRGVGGGFSILTTVESLEGMQESRVTQKL